MTCCFVLHHYGSSFADKAILGSHMVKSYMYLLCCSIAVFFQVVSLLVCVVSIGRSTLLVLVIGSCVKINAQIMIANYTRTYGTVKHCIIDLY